MQRRVGMLTRRDFLHTAALVTSSTAVTLLLTPLGCSSDGSPGPSTSTNPTSACDGAGGTSSVDQGHSHEICVPESELSSPPSGGATYTTTSADGHTHEVTLSRAQLESASRGETVVVTTTSDRGHTHTFSLRQEGTEQPQPGGGEDNGGGGPGGY